MNDNISKQPKRQARRRKKPKPPANGGLGFTTRRQTKKEKEQISSLTANIFNDQYDETEIGEQPVAPKPIKKTIPKIIKQESTYKDTSSEDDEDTEIPQRIVLSEGISQRSAFLIQKSASREIRYILNKHFGNADFDYFVHSENTYTLPYKGKRKKYKCILVEDKNGFKYNIWFDLSNVGMFGY